MSFGGVLYGIIGLGIVGFVAGVVFASVYNALSRQCRMLLPCQRAEGYDCTGCHKAFIRSREAGVQYTDSAAGQATSLFAVAWFTCCIRLLVGFVFVPEGIQKLIFPDRGRSTVLTQQD